MKKLLAMVLLGSCFVFSHAFANTAQQDKMKTCNVDASGKKGDERKAFMKSCLSNAPVAAEAPKSKMSVCNTAGKGKKGDEHKAFMKDCLTKK
ncbi:MAG: PsiF family protein [Glaciimonas sp.]|nr:PsiF family protein [Glaciimonas sp.]